MFRLILLTALAASVVAQEKQTGLCDGSIVPPPVTDVSSFADKTWYLVQSLGADWDGGECPTAITSRHPEKPKDILVTDRLFNFHGKKYQFTRSFVKSAHGVTQPLQAYVPSETDKKEFYILETDGATYSLLYSCVQDGSDQKTVFGSVYSTEKTLPPAAAAKVNAVINKYAEFKNGHWKIHDHSKCSF